MEGRTQEAWCSPEPAPAGTQKQRRSWGWESKTLCEAGEESEGLKEEPGISDPAQGQGNKGRTMQGSDRSGHGAPAQDSLNVSCDKHLWRWQK